MLPTYPYELDEMSRGRRGARLHRSIGYQTIPQVLPVQARAGGPAGSGGGASLLPPGVLPFAWMLSRASGCRTSVSSCTRFSAVDLGTSRGPTPAVFALARTEMGPPLETPGARHWPSPPRRHLSVGWGGWVPAGPRLARTAANRELAAPPGLFRGTSCCAARDNDARDRPDARLAVPGLLATSASDL